MYHIAATDYNNPILLTLFLVLTQKFGKIRI